MDFLKKNTTARDLVSKLCSEPASVLISMLQDTMSGSTRLVGFSYPDSHFKMFYRNNSGDIANSTLLELEQEGILECLKANPGQRDVRYVLKGESNEYNPALRRELSDYLFQLN